MKPMSKELAAMLEASEAKRKATKPNRETTPTQRVLAKIGKRIVRKIDGYKPKPTFNTQVPAEFCGPRGLRPTWHGRA